MDCNNIQKYFSEYIDDRLAENLKSVVESHMGTCPACREELAALKKVVDRVRDLPETRAPENFASQIDKRLEPASGLTSILQFMTTPFRFKIPFGFATATAMAAVLILMIHMEQPRQSGTGFNTEKQATHKFEGFMEPEKETESLPEALDEARPPKSEPVSPPLERKKQVPQQVFREKAELTADLEMAAAPAPAVKGAPAIMEWVLRIHITPDEDLDEKPLSMEKDTGMRGIASLKAGNLSAEKEESPTSAISEGLFRDEDDKRSSTTMDQAAADVAALTKDLGGKLVSSEKTHSPDTEYVIILTMPPGKVKDFYTELGRMGRFPHKPKDLPETPEDAVTIHLKLISP